MTAQQFDYVGRWTTKMFPKVSEIAMQQLETQKILSDYQDIKLLVSVFSEYYCINFPECLEETGSNESTDYRMKFVTLFLCCFEPEAIQGPYYKKLSCNTRHYLSQQIKTSGCQISQYLPKVRFYINRLKGYEVEIQQLIAMVKLRQGITNCI